MHIFLLGKGFVGEYLSIFLEKSFKTTLLSLKNTKLEKFEEIISTFDQNSIVIDLMDPNSFTKDTEQKFLKKAGKIREKILRKIGIAHYIFISSSNLYLQSTSLINESSPIKKIFESKYLQLKYKNEILLDQSSLPLTICRLPNIWGINEVKNSFFSDLLFAYHKKKEIDYRLHDDIVISFININDMCKLISVVIIKRILGIINISTNQFDSRYNLKSKVNKNKLKNITTSLGMRLISDKLNYKEYFTPTNLEF